MYFKPLKTKKKFNWNIDIDFSSVNHTDVLFFTKHLAMAIKSGVTLLDALDMLCDQASSKAVKKMLRAILEIIRSGKKFHEALEHYPKVFSAIYINLIKTGELSGTLQQNLAHLADQLYKSQELRRKIRSAMMYPMLVLIAVIGLGMSVALFVLPKILPLFKSLDVELPITTRALIWIADIMSAYGIWIVSLGALFLFFLFWFLRQDFIKPISHRFYLRLPVFGRILTHIQLERFCRTLGTLLQSGVTLDKSLRITADATDNWVYRKAINSLFPEIQKGNHLGATLDHYPHLFPKITSRMVAMGEKTGSLAHTFLYLSDMYADEVDGTMKNLSTILEPFLLIVIGVIVGLVAISILGPIYKITGGLQT